ncbi:MAG: hypothetical protein P4L22_05210, partial [Candidatus Babeliales bacterium]|nr:hypothetical protein [Candidatus Babeliales bacterium]
SHFRFLFYDEIIAFNSELSSKIIATEYHAHNRQAIILYRGTDKLKKTIDSTITPTSAHSISYGVNACLGLIGTCPYPYYLMGKKNTGYLLVIPKKEYKKSIKNLIFMPPVINLLNYNIITDDIHPRTKVAAPNIISNKGLKLENCVLNCNFIRVGNITPKDFEEQFQDLFNETVIFLKHIDDVPIKSKL